LDLIDLLRAAIDLLGITKYFSHHKTRWHKAPLRIISTVPAGVVISKFNSSSEIGLFQAKENVPESPTPRKRTPGSAPRDSMLTSPVYLFWTI
jgi:hypothetical protein